MTIFSVQTRQKTGILFSSAGPLGPGASAGFGPKETDGYSSIAILILSDQPFSINLFEAAVAGGPYELSQSYSSVSSSNVQSGPFPLVAAGPGFMVAQRFFPTGSFLKATLQNLSSLPQAVLSLLVQGIPTP